MDEQSFRDELECTWQRNEAELNRLHAANGPGRELIQPKIDELEKVQVRIEFYLGLEDVPPGSRKWSGMP
jgi:hypothetical protein